MPSRYRALVIYSLLLAAAAGTWLVADLRAAAMFPPWWAAALCVLGNLFVWQFSLKAPRVRLISMERIPRSDCCSSSKHRSLLRSAQARVGIIRGIHNAAMTTLMPLVAGRIYLALGDQHPLTALRCSGASRPGDW